MMAATSMVSAAFMLYDRFSKVQDLAKRVSRLANYLSPETTDSLSDDVLLNKHVSTFGNGMTFKLLPDLLPHVSSLSCLGSKGFAHIITLLEAERTQQQEQSTSQQSQVTQSSQQIPPRTQPHIARLYSHSTPHLPHMSHLHPTTSSQVDSTADTEHVSTLAKQHISIAQMRITSLLKVLQHRVNLLYYYYSFTIIHNRISQRHTQTTPKSTTTVFSSFYGSVLLNAMEQTRMFFLELFSFLEIAFRVNLRQLTPLRLKMTQNVADLRKITDSFEEIDEMAGPVGTSFQGFAHEFRNNDLIDGDFVSDFEDLVDYESGTRDKRRPKDSKRESIAPIDRNKPQNITSLYMTDYFATETTSSASSRQKDQLERKSSHSSRPQNPASFPDHSGRSHHGSQSSQSSHYPRNSRVDDDEQLRSRNSASFEEPPFPTRNPKTANQRQYQNQRRREDQYESAQENRMYRFQDDDSGSAEMSRGTSILKNSESLEHSDVLLHPSIIPFAKALLIDPVLMIECLTSYVTEVDLILTTFRDGFTVYTTNLAHKAAATTTNGPLMSTLSSLSKSNSIRVFQKNIAQRIQDLSIFQQNLTGFEALAKSPLSQNFPDIYQLLSSFSLQTQPQSQISALDLHTKTTSMSSFLSFHNAAMLMTANAASDTILASIPGSLVRLKIPSSLEKLHKSRPKQSTIGSNMDQDQDERRNGLKEMLETVRHGFSWDCVVPSAQLQISHRLIQRPLLPAESQSVDPSFSRQSQSLSMHQIYREAKEQMESIEKNELQGGQVWSHHYALHIINSDPNLSLSTLLREKKDLGTVLEPTTHPSEKVKDSEKERTMNQKPHKKEELEQTVSTLASYGMLALNTGTARFEDEDRISCLPSLETQSNVLTLPFSSNSTVSTHLKPLQKNVTREEKHRNRGGASHYPTHSRSGSGSSGSFSASSSSSGTRSRSGSNSGSNFSSSASSSASCAPAEWAEFTMKMSPVTLITFPTLEDTFTQLNSSDGSNLAEKDVASQEWVTNILQKQLYFDALRSLPETVLSKLSYSVDQLVGFQWFYDVVGTYKQSTSDELSNEKEKNTPANLIIPSEKTDDPIMTSFCYLFIPHAFSASNENAFLEYSSWVQTASRSIAGKQMAAQRDAAAILSQSLQTLEKSFQQQPQSESFMKKKNHQAISMPSTNISKGSPSLGPNVPSAPTGFGQTSHGIVGMIPRS